MAIRAKFRGSSAVKDTGGNEMVVLNAVYSQDPNDPNHEWSKYTPWGELRMNISNPPAQGQLVPGKEYYLTIEEAE